MFTPAEEAKSLEQAIEGEMHLDPEGIDATAKRSENSQHKSHEEGAAADTTIMNATMPFDSDNKALNETNSPQAHEKLSMQINNTTGTVKTDVRNTVTQVVTEGRESSKRMSVPGSSGLIANKDYSASRPILNPSPVPSHAGRHCQCHGR